VGYAGSRQVGEIVLVSLPLTFGRPGFGGVLVGFQPISGWRTTTPDDVRAWVASFSRSGRLLQSN
jgi:hypothetical protein